MKKKGQKKEQALSELQHKPFWAMLGILFLLSFLFTISSVDKSLTGNLAIQNIALAKAGSTFFLEVKSIPGVVAANLHVQETMKNSRISFTQDPAIVFDRLAYVKFKVTSSDAEKIGQIDFKFKISEKELRKAGINPQDLRLFVNGKELPLIQDKLENNYYHYSASSPELGEMVLGQKKPSELPATSLPRLKDSMLPTPEEEESKSEVEKSAAEVATAVVGKAAEQEVKVGFWTKVKEFFDKIFN